MKIPLQTARFICYHREILLISLMCIGLIAPVFAGTQVEYYPPEISEGADTGFDFSIPLTPSTSSDHKISLMYLESKNKTSKVPLLLGYLNGDFEDALVIITGKEKPDGTFSQVGSLTPDKSGLFVWEIPEKYQKMNYFQAIVIIGEEATFSEVLSHAPSGTYSSGTRQNTQIPAVSPVKTSSSPAPTPASGTVPRAVERYTTLTLQADTLSPSVGDTVTLSGRLTDSAGNGIARAQIGVEVPETSGEPSSTPLSTTRTDKEGRFRTTISTWQPGTVSIHVSYKGDDSHLAATSNPLMITAHE